jgi:hypothetical protein
MDWLDGQERRRWLDRQNERLGNALRYYAGPAAEPINALAQGAAALSPGADMMDMVQSGGDLMGSESGWDAAQNVGWLGASTLGMALPGTVRGYHAAWEPFEEYDWSRLGRSTAENQAGDGVWADNLARIGPWASEKPVNIGAPHSLPVDVGGKAKKFTSLDALEAAVRKAGGPEKFRRGMTDAGYGRISVVDEEFGGQSFVALTPENFKVAK